LYFSNILLSKERIFPALQNADFGDDSFTKNYHGVVLLDTSLAQYAKTLPKAIKKAPKLLQGLYI